MIKKPTINKVDDHAGKISFFNEANVILEKTKSKYTGKENERFIKADHPKEKRGAIIISRAQLSSFRSDYEDKLIPYEEIALEDRRDYGIMIEEDKNNVLSGKTDLEDARVETQNAINKVSERGLVWAAFNTTICDDEGNIYGEVDDIFYNEANGKYYVADTKTSKNPDTMYTWYQIAIYVYILNSLNKGKFSEVAFINHQRHIEMAREIKDTFRKEDWEDYKVSKEILQNTEAYKAKYSDKFIKLEEPEISNALIERNIREMGLLDLIEKEIELIKEYNIKETNDFEQHVVLDEAFKVKNDEIQSLYNKIKEDYFE